MALKWYALHTLSGQEGRVKEQLEHFIQVEKLESHFGRILMPTQDILTIKKGKKVSQTKKFFPSYLLVEMEIGKESMHVVMSTPGITNFVGGRKPLPIKQDEVDRILIRLDPKKRKSGSDIPFIIGDSVKIKDGPFKDFDGTIDSISIEKGKIKVMVSVFGRLTPVELDFLQVTPL